ncbi:MAG: nickel pincer cofactor biosynthesis protein LarB [Planctomycetota bacterium]|jgi:NCAIR mutase (PurE)-related protein|nr:nickel pincer cofactor biosynthesis protein LarB [Planctomycetota bacterium]
MSDVINLDFDREARCGLPEAIFAEFKTPAQCAAIATQLLARLGYALFTRVTPAIRDALIARLPDAPRQERGRALLLGAPPPRPRLPGTLLIVAAGTSDLPVVEEAALTAEMAGARVETLTDVGVAGLHRLLAATEKLRSATVIIAVAGMEGALPSVVGGLTAAPVIAVPTGVGYGAAFNGVAALLAMLNSCAAGVAVMNIDNGFGAAAHAVKILRQLSPRDDR